MNETNGQWERELVTKLATAALKEQRRARLWGIFFKLLTFAYISLILIMAVDWEGRDVSNWLENTATGGVGRAHSAAGAAESLERSAPPPDRLTGKKTRWSGAPSNEP